MSWEDVLKSPDEEPETYWIDREEVREDSANALESANTIQEKIQGISVWLSEVNHNLGKTDEMWASEGYDVPSYNNQLTREVIEQQKDVDALMEIIDEMVEKMSHMVYEKLNV